MTTITIDSIEIGERHRKDMGDLSGLIKSIEDVGLLQPIVITPDLRLIAGCRRIAAYRQLGRDEIEAHVIDLDDLLNGERAENTVRKDFTPSEAVAIGRAIEERQRKQNEARMLAGTNQYTEPSDKLPQGSGRTRDVVGRAVGMSGGTYEEAKAVVKAAEADPTLKSLVEEMDLSGRVSPARRKLKLLREGHPTAPTFKSRQVTAERYARIREMALASNRPQTIAAEVGISEDAVRSLLNKWGIPTVEARIGSSKRIDVAEVMAAIVFHAMPAENAVSLVEGSWAELPRERFGEWASELSFAIQVLNRLMRAMRKEVS